MSNGKRNVTFRMSKEAIEEFDDVIWELKTEGEISRDASRSDVIRKLIKEWMADHQGNPRTRTAAPIAD